MTLSTDSIVRLNVFLLYQRGCQGIFKWRLYEKQTLFFSLFISSVIALVFPSLSFAQGAASALKQYEGLKGKERTKRLSEGAKKEGRVVVYSFTAVDQLTPLLDEFQKRYPFIKAEHYRANATGVFNKFSTEARAGQTLADVIDISAGETHTLLQMGLIDPYLSPSREEFPKTSWTRKGIGRPTIIS